MTSAQSSNECLSPERLNEIRDWFIGTVQWGVAGPKGTELASMAQELFERRIEVEKYRAWAASCEQSPPETSDDPCVSHVALKEWERMFDAWVKHQAGLPADVPLWPNGNWSQDVAMIAHALANNAPPPAQAAAAAGAESTAGGSTPETSAPLPPASTCAGLQERYDAPAETKAEPCSECERLRNDIRELTCGDPRLVCPNCRPDKPPVPACGELSVWGGTEILSCGLPAGHGGAHEFS